MNRQVKWFALGFLHGAGLALALAMYASAVRPPELPYRSATPTFEPTPGPAYDIGPRLDLPPCDDMGVKDCMWLHAPVVKQHYAQQATPIPEPGTLALISAGLVGIITLRSRS